MGHMHQLRTEGRGTAHQERGSTHLRSHRIQAPRDHHSGKAKVLFPRIHRQLPQRMRTLRRVVEDIHILYARHCSGIHRICNNISRVVPVIVRSRAWGLLIIGVRSPSNLYFKAKSMISLTFFKAFPSCSGGPKMKQRIASSKVLWRVIVPGELNADKTSKATPITIPICVINLI